MVIAGWVLLKLMDRNLFMSLLLIGSFSACGAGGSSDVIDNKGCDDISDLECTEGVDAECIPVCDDRECGSNGCGGICGTCASPKVCSDGLCGDPGVCTPDCAGKDCGHESVCGTSCGTCGATEECDNYLCKDLCPSICEGKNCGFYNECNCGTCNNTQICQGNQCQDCQVICGDNYCGSYQGCECGVCGLNEFCDGSNVCQDQCPTICAGKDCGVFHECDCGVCVQGKTCLNNRCLCMAESETVMYYDGPPCFPSCDPVEYNISADTTEEGNEFEVDGIFGGFPGRDYVIEMRMEKSVPIDIVVTPQSSEYDVALVIAKSYVCSSSNKMSYIRYANENGAGGVEQILEFSATEDGLYYLVIDSEFPFDNASGFGPFQVHLAEH